MQLLRDINHRNRFAHDPTACLASVCSAHAQVLIASLLMAQAKQSQLLVEATSNQVNQFGGYTGLLPADFIAYVHSLCDRHQIDRSLVLFGGDHLGPQCWRNADAGTAMQHAGTLVASFVQAGFTKIHLDCSEGCEGEPAQVSDALSAERAATLAQVCEASAADPRAISYVIGTEVPPPGGARAGEEPARLKPTTSHNAQRTLQAHEAAFLERDLAPAWKRVVGLVVQPGLEFSPEHIHHFDASVPDQLSEALAAYPHMAFEAHSTDYQKPWVYGALARRHFTVLKVGPALTFAYRQAIYALDALATWLVPDPERVSVPQALEAVMQAEPQQWAHHYSGDAQQQYLLRHFSYADRARYYWLKAPVTDALTQLTQVLSGQARPMEPLLSQYFSEAVIGQAEDLLARGYGWTQALVLAQVQMALKPYLGPLE